jgi:hypothetical protein
MFKTQKYVFLEALIITVFIFALGIIAGLMLENWRNEKVENTYQITEVSLLDARIQSDIYSNLNWSCIDAVMQNIDFADKIYEEAKQLDRYQKASIITGDLRLSHKKYDLLRAMLLLNSIRIRQKCSKYYDEVVYLYRYNTKSENLIVKENIFSKVLEEVKNVKGNEILLIPLAGDNNSSSIDLLMKNYNVTRDDLPIIIINGNVTIKELKTSDEILKFLK